MGIFVCARAAGSCCSSYSH